VVKNAFFLPSCEEPEHHIGASSTPTATATTTPTTQAASVFAQSNTPLTTAYPQRQPTTRVTVANHAEHSVVTISPHSSVSLDVITVCRLLFAIPTFIFGTHK